MRQRIKKYFNIYVVSGLLAVFSILYFFSFIFIFNDIGGSSSREMKQKFCQKYPDKCMTPAQKKLSISE